MASVLQQAKIDAAAQQTSRVFFDGELKSPGSLRNEVCEDEQQQHRQHWLVREQPSRPHPQSLETSLSIAIRTIFDTSIAISALRACGCADFNRHGRKTVLRLGQSARVHRIIVATYWLPTIWRCGSVCCSGGGRSVASRSIKIESIAGAAELRSIAVARHVAIGDSRLCA